MVLNLSQRPTPKIGQAYIPGMRGGMGRLSGTGVWPPPDGSRYTNYTNNNKATISNGHLVLDGGAGTYPLTSTGFTTGSTNWIVDWDAATGKGKVSAPSLGANYVFDIGVDVPAGTVAAVAAPVSAPAAPTSAISTVSPVGSTDASGSYTQSGTIAAGDAGSWDGSYTVGGQPAGAVHYTVVPPPAPPKPPSIQFFKADPAAVAPGETATLSWLSDSATAQLVTITNKLTGQAQQVSWSGSLAVTPAATTVYVLSVKGTDGTTVQASATVAVAARVPLSASITNLTQGGGTTFAPGDQYQIRVTGPPNEPVTATIVHSGLSGLAGLGRGTRESGVTDAGGGLVVQGVMGAEDAGSWSEQWWVGDAPAGDLEFQVVDTVSPTASAAAASSSSAAQTSPWLLLAAIAAGAYFLSEGVGGKR